MTEQDIMTILKNKRRYETEIAILRDCTEALCDAMQENRVLKYAMLKRKMSLINHWLNLLPDEESSLINSR